MYKYNLQIVIRIKIRKFINGEKHELICRLQHFIIRDSVDTNTLINTKLKFKKI